jgi:hypothetical protein
VILVEPTLIAICHIAEKCNHGRRIGMEHLGTDNVIIMDFADAHLRSVKPSTGCWIDGPVPKHRAHRTSAIVPKVPIKASLFGALQHTPCPHESLSVSQHALQPAPYSAPRQHGCLGDLDIVGIAGEHVLKVALLNRGEQPTNDLYLPGHGIKFLSM